MSADSSETSARQAAALLHDIARLRRDTRRSLGQPWLPPLCFGALTILSAPLVAHGSAALLPLWIVAGTGVMLLVGRHFRRRAQRDGVAGRGRQLWWLAAGMFAACLAAGVAGGALGGAHASVLAPIAVILASYIAVGWLQRSRVPALAVGPAAGLAAALAVAGTSPWIVELTFGLGLMAAGAALYRAGRCP